MSAVTYARGRGISHRTADFYQQMAGDSRM